MYSPIQLENDDCTFVSDKPDVAIVDNSGVVTAVASGTAKVTVSYGNICDEVDVIVS